MALFGFGAPFEKAAGASVPTTLRVFAPPSTIPLSTFHFHFPLLPGNTYGMSFSLYVEKTDGSREDLDNVSPEIAREVFAKVDWNAAMKAMAAADEAGTSFFFPEFGVADDEGLGHDAQRTLVLSPVDEQTVSFQFASHGRMWQMDELAFDEAPRLIDLFFAGDDEGLAAITNPPPIETRELSADEFRSTILPPPDVSAENEKGVYNRVRLRDYVTASLGAHHLPASADTIVLENLVHFADYHDYTFDKQYSHLVFHYGDREQWLVIVVKLARSGVPERILGHHFLRSNADCYTPGPLSADEEQALRKFDETRRARYWGATLDEGVQTGMAADAEK